MTGRVHVVFTGGTIGSSRGDDRTDLDPKTSRQLLSCALEAPVTFTTSEPFSILSEDATLDHWTLLAKHLAELDFSRLDAVVVAHGSDTLAWTAHALAYALHGVPKPVVLVASDLPLSDSFANGPQNFRDAIAFALSEKLPGVFVAWKNPHQDTILHLGTRILPCDTHDDMFRSVLGLHFGTQADGEFRRNPALGNPSRSQLATASQPGNWLESIRWAQMGSLFESNLLVLPAQPGYRSVHGDPTSWKAVLQLPYHSGTACSAEGPFSLHEFALTCHGLGIPFLLGPVRHPKNTYASIQRLVRCGVQLAPHLSESALTVKIRWLLATGQNLSRLSEPIAFDLLSESTLTTE